MSRHPCYWVRHTFSFRAAKITQGIDSNKCFFLPKNTLVFTDMGAHSYGNYPIPLHLQNVRSYTDDYRRQCGQNI